MALGGICNRVLCLVTDGAWCGTRDGGISRSLSRKLSVKILKLDFHPDSIRGTKSRVLFACECYLLSSGWHRRKARPSLNGEKAKFLLTSPPENPASTLCVGKRLKFQYSISVHKSRAPSFREKMCIVRLYKVVDRGKLALWTGLSGVLKPKKARLEWRNPGNSAKYMCLFPWLSSFLLVLLLQEVNASYVFTCAPHSSWVLFECIEVNTSWGRNVKCS